MFFILFHFSRPHTWYPIARKKNRSVVLHVGPTNSGKTFHALKQLESSSSGIYCGPLRLLAWEVAKRLNKAKVPCDLITGQEREEIEGAKHKAVTVEMADVNSEYDCAVIDEIQACQYDSTYLLFYSHLAMVGCRTRGHSFTRALLGIPANELHLCGDAAAVPLIKEILGVTDDDVKVQYYERLSPLVPSKIPLGPFSNIKRGDCIVTFSRQEIYKLKKKVQDGGKHLCSVVYGSLPAETRTRQASMFNDASSEFDVLVASDAIGMGLNLNISRIIFSTLKKYDGLQMRDLTVPEIKQISGRAGRYQSKFPVGEVTCLHRKDLPLLHEALDSPSPTLERAGLFPTYDLLFMYSRLHLNCGLYQILEHFVENAKLSANYFLADCEDMLKVAAVIDELPLGLHDKYLFCVSPVDMDDDISSQGLTQFAQSYAKNGIVRLREMFTPGTLQVPKTSTALKELESIHKVLDLYVWLSFRLEESFPDQKLAASQKAICSSLIEEFLERQGWQVPSIKRLPRRFISSSRFSRSASFL
ncbi:hypothetical protein RJ639_028995 [Escallonia herrerae]|uniref:RNA helicase n=1 Tax=Escallonia herrerae TaxID=1293975 RepID=A0AA88X8Q1_9ASTE|nr:hypothetical protein RJ639_028995 [Escallonia herrerae]